MIVLKKIVTILTALVCTGFFFPRMGRAQCTTEWTNAAGGFWNVPGNWSAGVPGPSDNACITLDATYSVTLDVTTTVNSLTLGAISGAHTQSLAHGSSRT